MQRKLPENTELKLLLQAVPSGKESIIGGLRKVTLTLNIFVSLNIFTVDVLIYYSWAFTVFLQVDSLV